MMPNRKMVVMKCKTFLRQVFFEETLPYTEISRRGRVILRAWQHNHSFAFQHDLASLVGAGRRQGDDALLTPDRGDLGGCGDRVAGENRALKSECLAEVN